MRYIVFALLLAICCMVVYASAAALPEHALENSEIAMPQEYNEINEDEESALINGEDDEHTAEGAQSRTLFLLLPLLFPNQFYFS